MSSRERIGIAQKLTSSGMFPPEGIDVIRWDGTPDGWGIIVTEAESVEAVVRAIEMWRVAGAGFFKTVKTAPAAPIQELVPVIGEIIQTMAETD
ncbi:MAG TPA: hypothetical protein DCP37_13820 [Dehalococcoidia bacterium]|nr:hypothetical protein [SAR202 cluster bacterium]HAL48824.1 hypothetical protein [Dehalococcoidia bacterium]